jgi:hypothetical protein
MVGSTCKNSRNRYLHIFADLLQGLGVGGLMKTPRQIPTDTDAVLWADALLG